MHFNSTPPTRSRDLCETQTDMTCKPFLADDAVIAAQNAAVHGVFQRIDEAVKRGKLSVSFKGHPKITAPIKLYLENCGYKCAYGVKYVPSGLRITTLPDVTTLIISWEHKL